MKKILIVLPLLFATSVYALDCNKLGIAVKLCVFEVNSINVKEYRPRQFDAYFDFNACMRGESFSVRYFGTDRERFLFEKCMTEHNFPITK